MLTSETALPDLKRRLDEAGFAAEAPSLELFWPVWREWSALPVEDMDPEQDDDMLLFECSLNLRAPDEYDAIGPKFVVAFTRQFTHNDADGEYLGMEQLGADFVYPPHQDFRAITTMSSFSEDFGTADSFWGMPGPRVAEWAAKVEATRSYRVALEHDAWRFSVGQGRV